MIQMHDEQALRAMLGLTDSIPAEVEAEYKLRINLFHRAGQTGPMGPAGLVDLVRSLGLRPPVTAEPIEQTDWRLVPQDGSIRVEALYFGYWQPGVYLGPVEGGTLAIRLDGDDFVRECRPGIVRMVGVEDPEFEDEPSEQAQMLEDPPPDPPKPYEPAPETQVEPEQAPFDDSESEPDPPVEDAPGKPAFDWEAVQKGAAVWVTVDDDVKDGTLVANAPDGLLEVLVEGEEKPRLLGRKDVVYAE